MKQRILTSPPKAPVKRSVSSVLLTNLGQVEDYLNQAKSIVSETRLKKENRKLTQRLNSIIESQTQSPLDLLNAPSIKERNISGNSSKKDVSIFSFEANHTQKIELDQNYNDSQNSQAPMAHLTRTLVPVRNVFDSIDEEEKWDPEADDLRNNFFIDMNSKFYRIWQTFVFYLILYTILVTPLRIAFFDLISYSFMEYLDIVVDFSYFLDLILNFFFSFKNEDDKIITSSKKIALAYLNSFFFIDLFCAFPLGLFSFFLEKDIRDDFYRSLSYWAWLRMLRILKLSKLSKKKDQAQEISGSSLKSKLIQFFQICFLVVATIHIFACFYVFLAKSSINEHSWLEANNLSDSFETYIASIYFHLVTMFSIGYGDIVPTNTKERVYSIIYLFISVMVYSFLISVSASYFFEKDKRTRLYLNKVSKLDQIKQRYSLEWKIYDRVKNYLKRQHKSTFDEWYPFIESLPSSCRREMLLVMHKRYLRELVFFKNRSHDFILNALPTFKPFKVNKGDILTDIGEYVDEMYIVTKGKLSVGLGESLYNLRVGEILQYEHFGDCFMFLNERFTYRLTSHVKTSDVLVVKKNDFNQLKDNFYEELRKIIEKGKILLERLIERERLINILNAIKPDVQFIKSSLAKIDKHLLKEGFEAYFYGDDDECRARLLARDLEKLLDKLAEEVNSESSKMIVDQFNDQMRRRRSLLQSGSIAWNSISRLRSEVNTSGEASRFKPEEPAMPTIDPIGDLRKVAGWGKGNFRVESFSLGFDPSYCRRREEKMVSSKECEFNIRATQVAASFSFVSGNRSKLKRTQTPVQNNFYQSVVFKGNFVGKPKPRTKKRKIVDNFLEQAEKKFIKRPSGNLSPGKRKFSANDLLMQLNFNKKPKKGSEMVTDTLKHIERKRQERIKHRSSMNIPNTATNKRFVGFKRASKIKEKHRSSVNMPNLYERRGIEETMMLKENKTHQAEEISKLDNIYKILIGNA